MYDAIVIGAGGMGSAALYALARRGLRVLGLEQHALGHSLGSSYGETRAVRRAYFENPNYVPLVVEACAKWRELESECGEELFVESGLILAGRPETELMAGSKESARVHNLPLETFSPDDAERAFPGFAFDDDMEVLLDPGGGFVWVEKSVDAHQRLAGTLGADIRAETVVVDWRSDGASVAVRTPTESFTAAHLVICAGPWTSRLLHSIDVSLTVERAILGWFGLRDTSAYRRADGSPVFAYDLGETGFYYGFPNLDGDSVKVARHGGTNTADDPDTIARELLPSDFQDVRGFTGKYMPHLSDALRNHSICMYTMTDDGHFYIDTHPEFGNVHFACGFSGHGYKFAPVVGEILADFVEKDATERAADFLRLTRG